MQLTKRQYIAGVLAIGAVLLLPGVIMGLDVCDAGFYTVFYENIFDAPDTVEYNFMYYLSGLIGGVTAAIFPEGGMVWLRIVGAVFVLLSVWMVLASYRDLVSRRIAAVGTLCVVVAYTGAPLTLSYDIVSLLLISGSLTCLLCAGRKGAVFGAGVLAGLALFARIPNVLFFLLILLIWWREGMSRRERAYCSLLFAGGYLAAVGAVMGYMYVSGDWCVFAANMKTLANVSADGEASHGLSGLVLAQVKYYLLLMRLTLKLIVLGAWCMLAARAKHTLLRRLLYLPAGLYLCYLIIKTPAVLVLGGAILPALIIMSLPRYGGTMVNVARAALLTALLLPCGSDHGGTNIGSILYLWGAPAAMAGVWQFRLSIKGVSYRLSHKVTYGGIAAFAWITLWQTLNGGLYFDSTPATEMGGKISNGKMSGILTSAERADAINTLLPRLQQYVAPGDTLFAYGSIPLVNYLTSTRPFIGCSWPEQLSAAALEQRLAESTARPVVCVQRFATLGNKWGQPSVAFVEGAEPATVNVYHTSAKWNVVKQFLENKGYRQVSGTSAFDIYLPPSKQSLQ